MIIQSSPWFTCLWYLIRLCSLMQSELSLTKCGIDSQVYLWRPERATRLASIRAVTPVLVRRCSDEPTAWIQGTMRPLPPLLRRPVPRPQNTYLSTPRISSIRRSSTAATGAASTRPTTRTTSSSSSPTRSRWPRRLLYATIFGGLGLYTGKNATAWLSAPPAPGTPDDAREMQRIQSTLDALPIVRQLRSDASWAEWSAYEAMSEDALKRRLTSGPLKGSRAFAVQVSTCFNDPPLLSSHRRSARKEGSESNGVR